MASQTEKVCALDECDEPVEWPSLKYCGPKHCRRANYLQMKERGYWAARYQEEKKWWQRTGMKKAGVSMFAFLKMPRMFRR